MFGFIWVTSFPPSSHNAPPLRRERDKMFSVLPPAEEKMESIGLSFITLRSVLISWQGSGSGGEIYAGLLP